MGKMDCKQVYTVAEVTALMELSPRTVIRLFEHDPGVIFLERPEINTRGDTGLCG
jgi:hypothetical protein